MEQQAKARIMKTLEQTLKVSSTRVVVCLTLEAAHLVAEMGKHCCQGRVQTAKARLRLYSLGAASVAGFHRQPLDESAAIKVSHLAIVLFGCDLTDCVLKRDNQDQLVDR